MNGKFKKKISRAVSSALVVAMTLSLVAAADIADDSDVAYASGTSDEMGSGEYTTPNTVLIPGKEYSFGGYKWIAAEQCNGYVVLQSKGVTGGQWPGRTMSQFGNKNNYNKSIEYENISDYDNKMTTLYNDIKASEYQNATYGKGLYLIPQGKATDNYNVALKAAAEAYSLFGASSSYAWLGTYYGSSYAYYVNSSGSVSGSNQNDSCVVAPAFNLNPSLVNIDDTGSKLTVFTPSTGINITQSITSVDEGETVDLSQVFSAVKYVGGDNDGKPATYKISVSDGTLNGTKWTAPAGINTDKPVTLTVTETKSGNNWNAITNVVVKATGWIDTDGAADENGFYSYEDKDAGITWKYKSNDDGSISCLYTEDDVSGIISSSHVLVVPSSINGVQVKGIGGGTTKNGNNIPFIPTDGAKVNNTWTSIYLPQSIRTINNGAFYKSGASADIVIPGTVTNIGANAFKESLIKTVVFNSADSVKDGLELHSNAFADIATLTAVAIRRSGVTLGYKTFANDDGLTTIDIPNGTTFKGPNGADDSFAFDNATNLTVIKMDAATVSGNVFSNTQNLEKVIFGENVANVKYNWTGTAASNTTAPNNIARTTYVLNADTIFEMDKANGGSPFGYAEKLTVIGKSHSLDGWSDYFSDANDPVTAKVAYLAANYTNQPTVRGYAQGTASYIEIKASDDPANDDGVITEVPTDQTGIEAYYNGILFAGDKATDDKKTLKKEKMTVYKMLGTTQGDKYNSSEFYVLRALDADALLARENIEIEQNDAGEFVAVKSDEIIKEYADRDKVTATNIGTVDVKVVILLKDANGKVLLDKGTNGRVKAYVYSVTIPVKEYTAEDDFLENYGSYQAVIDKIAELDKQIEANQEKEEELNNMTKQLNELIKEYSDLIGATTPGDSDYTYSVTDKDGNTTDYVHVNGEEATYDKETATEATLPDGTKVTVYEGTDKDGNKFLFYVKEDGVHIVELNPSNNEVTDDKLSSTESDKIAAIQKKLAAQLATINKELETIISKMDEVKDDLGLDCTDEEWNKLTAEQKMAVIANAVKTMKADYTSVSDRLTAAENTTAELNKVLAVLNKIGAGSSVTSDELALVAGLSNYPDLDELIKKGSDSSSDNSAAKIAELAAIIQEGCKDDPSTAENEYGIYSDATLDAVGQYSKVIASVLEGLSDEISALRNTVATQLSTIETQKQTIADKQAQIDALQSGNVNEAYANAQKEIAALNVKLNDLTVEVEDLSKQILNMQSELNTLKTLIASIRSLLGIDADDDIIAAIKGLQDTIKENATTIENLKKELADAKENGGDTTKAYTEGYNTGFVDGFQSASKNAGNTANNGNSGNTANTTNSDNIDELKNQNQTLVNEIATLKDKVTDYNNALKQNADLSAKLTEKNNTLAEKNTSLTKQNNELAEKNNQLTEQIGNLSSAVENQNQAIAGLKNQVANTPQTQIQTDTGLTSEVRNLASEVSSQNQAISGLKSQVASAGKTSSTSTQQRTQSSTTPAASTTPSTTATPAATTTPITLKGTSTEEDTESDEIAMEDTEEETEREDLSSASLDFNNIGNGLSTEESSTEEFTEADDDEEKGGSPLGAIMVILVVLAVAGGAVFMFVIKPRLDAQADEYEDDDDDDIDEDDETI